MISEKEIKKVTDEICNEIGSICNSLCCEHDNALEHQYDYGTSISDDEFGQSVDEQRDELCEKVKSLGKLAVKFRGLYLAKDYKEEKE